MNNTICVVTYTTIDNAVRTQTLALPESDSARQPGDILDNISTYLETRKWPEEPFAKTPGVIFWGLNPCHVRRKYARSTQLNFPFESSFVYYHWILQKGVVADIAGECVRNPDFAREILAEAAVRAQNKDDTSNTSSFIQPCYTDALTRAKRRIQRNQKKEDGLPEVVAEFARVIEAFELYTVLSVQPRE